MNKNTSFNNLIDLCIEFDENPETQGGAQKMFVEFLISYFFKIEIDLSKKFGMYFENFKAPDFLKDKPNFIDVNTSELEKYIEADIISETFSGKIKYHTSKSNVVGCSSWIRYVLDYRRGAVNR